MTGRRSSTESEAQKVTVGICAYNEEKNIGILLDNIATRQELPFGSEIMVVCSGCTDNTAELVNRRAEKDSRIKLHVEAERHGKASAINYILANGTGDTFLFVSADTLPWKSCFKSLLSKLQTPEVGVVCGKPVPVNAFHSLTDKLVHALWFFHDQVFEELDNSGLARHATEIFVIRKGIVKKIPDETINDDAYIALVARKKGWVIRYSSDSGVSICGPKTFSDYIKQRRRILQGHRQVRKATGESPQHLLYIFPKHPILAASLVLSFIKKKGFATFLAFAMVEFTINAVSSIDSLLKRKTNPAWSIASSTKTLVSGPFPTGLNIGAYSTSDINNGLPPLEDRV